MGKNARNIFKRTSKTRLSVSSNKTGKSEKSNGSQEILANDNESQPIDKEHKKNEKPEFKSNLEQGDPKDFSNLKNTKLDRNKMKEKAKQISENNRSLKRKKKKNVVKQILSGFQQPKEAINSSLEEKENYASSQVSKAKDQLRSSSRNIQRGVPIRDSSNRRTDGHGKENPHSHTNMKDSRNGDRDNHGKMASEEIYESRKLLIRQMQGMIAKDHHKSNRQNKGKESAQRKPDEVVSEYDSWSDLEENFAKGFNLNLRDNFLPYTKYIV